VSLPAAPRTPGQAAFERFQLVRWPLCQATPWAHFAVDIARPAWEAAGEGAICLAVTAGHAAAIAEARHYRDLLEAVREALAGHRNPPAARRLALGLIATAETTGRKPTA
jgi:hypothetical protein